MLDHVPAQLRVRVIRRPRYGCRACEEAVVQAPAPERPIDGGMATEALLAHVLVNKYSDHLPLYRQVQIFARQGVTLDRSTLCNWVGRACWWLAPLHELILSTVLASPKVFADDTTLPVLDPGRGRTKTGRLWCYAVDNRPWCGPGHPAAAYMYSEDRKSEHPASHLRAFRGLLQVDGYAGFARLVADDAEDVPQLAFCWAHVRRKFYDIHLAIKAPLADQALRRIAALYEIEADIRGKSAEIRRAQRQQRSRPLVEAMKPWLNQQLGYLSGRSTLAQAIRYALNHWDGLILFLDDGRLELDTNTVERAIRPVALGRKNALFAGSDSGGRHWAILASLIQTAKLNNVDPLAWLADVLERIVSRRTKRHELDTLLPWNWKARRQRRSVQLSAPWCGRDAYVLSPVPVPHYLRYRRHGAVRAGASRLCRLGPQDAFQHRPNISIFIFLLKQNMPGLHLALIHAPKQPHRIGWGIRNDEAAELH